MVVSPVLPPNNNALDGAQNLALRDLVNQNCSLTTLFVYLKNHKAETLTRVVDAVETYSKANPTPETRFLLAADIEAATNIVEKASHNMMHWGYGAVILPG